MSDTITVTGFIATPPRNLKTSEGLSISSFRLASAQRRFDRGQQKWVDADTNWYTVTAFRQLASNASTSLQKGDRVVVTGRVHVRDWESAGRKGTTIEIEAEALGHDLFWGTTSFTRTLVSTVAGGADGQPTSDQPAADLPAADSWASSTAPIDPDPETDPGAAADESTELPKADDSVAVPF